MALKNPIALIDKERVGFFRIYSYMKKLLYVIAWEKLPVRRPYTIVCGGTAQRWPGHLSSGMIPGIFCIVVRFCLRH